MTASVPGERVTDRGAGLLRDRDRRLLLAGQAASELGSQVGGIALPLVAVLALPAGVWVDRAARRPVLVGADLVRGVALLTVPVAAGLHRLSLVQLAVVALATGTARVLFDVAYPSYLPALVGRDQLVGANAWLESSRSATQLTGPGLGGWLVQLAGAPLAVAADAASFLVSAGCLLAIRAAEPDPPRPAGPANLRRELAEGLRFVLGQPVLRAITACTALTNLLWAAAGTVQLLFLVHQVGLDPAAIGLLLSAGRPAAWSPPWPPPGSPGRRHRPADLAAGHGDGAVRPLHAADRPRLAGRPAPPGGGRHLLRPGPLQHRPDELPPGAVPAGAARAHERQHPVPGLRRPAPGRAAGRPGRRAPRGPSHPVAGRVRPGPDAAAATGLAPAPAGERS